MHGYNLIQRYSNKENIGEVLRKGEGTVFQL